MAEEEPAAKKARTDAGQKRFVVVNGEKYASHGLLLPEDGGEAQPRGAAFCASGRELPHRVDLRQWCTEVENQRQTNSCVSNACVGACEFLCKRAKSADGSEEVGELSRRFLYFMARRRHLRNRGMEHMPVTDNGSFLHCNLQELLDTGCCKEDICQLTEGEINHIPSPEAVQTAENWKVLEWRDVPVDVTAMKAALADGFPIIFGLKLTQRFFNPGPSGIIRTPNVSDPQSANHGLHCMLLVGYSERHQTFICRNSWSENYGDKGYCYIPYDYAGSPTFNLGGMYVITKMSNTNLDDATPEDVDQDDGEDIFVPNEEDEFDDTTGQETLFEEWVNLLEEQWQEQKTFFMKRIQEMNLPAWLKF